MIKRVRALFFAAALVAIPSVVLSAPPQIQPPAQYVPNEVLVKFKPGQESAGLLLTASLRATVASTIPQLKVQRLRLPAGTSVPYAMYVYRSSPAVQYAEPNYKQKWFEVPNDPRFAQQYGAIHMRLPQAWDITHGSPSVLIAIIDSGMDTDHPDLGPNFAFGKDYVDGDDDPNPTVAHGTHVAGTAAAVTNNGIGVAGMGYNCKFIGISHDLTIATSAAAMMWAADNGAKVINMSYGYVGPSTQTESDAVDYAWSKGVLLVAAAGNSNYNGLDSYPNGYEKVLSVGATGVNGQKWAFSDWGPRVDVAAPGENIMSTYWPGQGYQLSSGTSMASPGVAGVAALLFAYGGPGTTNAEVRSALENTAVNVGPWVQNGRVDAEAALGVIRPLIDVNVLPSTITPHEGTHMSGTTVSTLLSDNLYYSMATTTLKGLGETASAISEFTIPYDPNDLRASKLVVEAKGATLATAFLYLWNGTTWVSFRQFPLRETDNTFTVDMGTTLRNYIVNGKVKIMTRANRVPRRSSAPFTLGIDLVKLETKIQS